MLEVGVETFSAEDLARHARAPATLRAYAADWRAFSAWAASQGLDALPATPQMVGRYVADQAGRLTPGTLERRVSAIVVAHRQAGYVLDRHHPAIAEPLAGLRRLVGSAAQHQKAALTGAELRAIVATLPQTLTGQRDRAVLLLGYAGAFRRSELAALQLSDLCWTGDGVAVTVRRRKEDAGGWGGVKGIPFGSSEASCPVRALQRWIMAAGLDEGPTFRPIDRHGNLGEAALSGDAVADIVKRSVRHWALASGRAVSASQADELAASVAGHSLRAGMITTAAREGASDWDILEVSLHRSRRSLGRYVRGGRWFANPAAAPGL
jgi:integrase